MSSTQGLCRSDEAEHHATRPCRWRWPSVVRVTLGAESQTSRDILGWCIFVCTLFVLFADCITPNNTASPLTRVSQFLNAMIQAPYSKQCVYTSLLSVLFFRRPQKYAGLYDAPILYQTVICKRGCCKSSTNQSRASPLNMLRRMSAPSPSTAWLISLSPTQLATLLSSAVPPTNAAFRPPFRPLGVPG